LNFCELKDIPRQTTGGYSASVSVGTATYCTVLFTVAAAWTEYVLSSPFRRNGGNTATNGPRDRRALTPKGRM